MPDSLETRLELLAKEAESLPAFGGLNLLSVRREIGKVLSLIGRGGFFEEYTRHDVSHIDQMLKMTAWLIPEDTWQKLTPADGLLQTLSIYFHDLGLLVTREEYGARDRDVLDRFREELFEGPFGVDYRARIEALGTDGAERFVYQEFVRAHHGQRVRAWISGSAPSHLGAAEDAAKAVHGLLAPLGSGFRDDLGLVCESHHADDLDQVDKYLISRPYGSSDDETANVQYAAIMLRTADLLHITSDRTPSIMYKLISPTDPVSQQEWAKQGSVESVRAKPGVDEENNIDLSASRNTVEVFADFSDEEGFFGLTDYLAYARRQLHQTYDWAETAEKRHGAVYRFPWRSIDDENVKTKGFLRESFHFTLDQDKVLDLLTGHTLYNNTNVVLRELVQNSLDAIRLQEALAPKPSTADSTGHVRVRWDSKDRILTVSDNGTGMTQEVIERHLLTVGSSLYQDPEFQRQHPDFSAISRFGIGVLSTFMISDSVTVTTVHPNEDSARRLSLRSVHGRYLIRLLDKSAPEITDLVPHGTAVAVRVRPSATIRDVAGIVEGWVVVPRCRTTLIVDDEEPIDIGFQDVGAALAAMTQGDDAFEEDGNEHGDTGSTEPRQGQTRIIQVSKGGVDLAFAVRWSDYFKEWTFVNVRGFGGGLREKPYGTCVEGIRVASGTPGFRELGIAAIANATGRTAPKTDVARSGLENTPELRATHSAIYELLCAFVTGQLQELVDERGFSLTWAAQEARWLIGPLINSAANDWELLLDIASRVPLLVVDDNGKRALASPYEIAAMPQFWTAYSAYFRSAESLLRELPTTASVGALSGALGVSDFDPPSGPLLTTPLFRDPLGARAFAGKEVATVVIRRNQRRVDLGWEDRENPPRWRILAPRSAIDPEVREVLRSINRPIDVLVAMKDVRVEGRDRETCVHTDGMYHLFHDGSVARYLNSVLDAIGDDRSREANLFRAYLTCVLAAVLPERGFARRIGNLREFLERGVQLRAERIREIVAQYSSLADLEAALMDEDGDVFNPDAWQRSAGTSEDFFGW